MRDRFAAAWAFLQALARRAGELGLLRDLHIYGGTVLLAVGAEHMTDGAGFATAGGVLLLVGVFGLPSFSGTEGPT